LNNRIKDKKEGLRDGIIYIFQLLQDKNAYQQRLKLMQIDK